jgi:endo-1,3-1,4-beta-glycanase ExoK
VTTNRFLAALAFAGVAACEAGLREETDAVAEADVDTAVEAAEQEGRPSSNLAFVERFEADLDDAVWIVSDGWTNGDWMDTAFRRSQTQVGPDGLTITLAPADDPGEVGQPYVTGEIRTLGRYDGGYFEIDMQVPRGAGLVTGFFTYTGAAFGDPHDEIDIEILGKDTTEGMFTIFTNDVAKTTYVPLGFDAAERFHLYAFEWTADYIRWYVDGRLVHEETGDELPLPTTPQIFYLNLWNSSSLTDWLGELDVGAIPQTLHVACMAAAERYEGEPLCRRP